MMQPRSRTRRFLVGVVGKTMLAGAIAAHAACSQVGTYGGSEKPSETPGKDSDKEGSSKRDSPGRVRENQTGTKTESEGVVAEEESPLEVEDDSPQPPINITGVYLTCSAPYGLKADAVALDCRMERDGQKIDDDLLLSSVTWKFRSPKPELVPRIDLNPRLDWHAAYVFDGRATLSSEDLSGSAVFVELATTDADTRELSVAYRQECRSHKPASASCITSPAGSIRPPSQTSYRANGDHLLLSWTDPVAPALGALVVKCEPNNRNLTFDPVAGQQYVAGTIYGKEEVMYAGPQTSLQDPDVAFGTDYSYVVYHHDQNFVYGPGMIVSFTYTPLTDGSGNLTP